jgi:hypothetical protein
LAALVVKRSSVPACETRSHVVLLALAAANVLILFLLRSLVKSSWIDFLDFVEDRSCL